MLQVWTLGFCAYRVVKDWDCWESPVARYLSVTSSFSSADILLRESSLVAALNRPWPLRGDDQIAQGTSLDICEWKTNRNDVCVLFHCDHIPCTDDWMLCQVIYCSTSEQADLFMTQLSVFMLFSFFITIIIISLLYCECYHYMSMDAAITFRSWVWLLVYLLWRRCKNSEILKQPSSSKQ